MAHILIIDDNDIICETLSYIITDLGHTVATANRLGDGLALVSSKNFDVVFLDVYLPDGNGLSRLTTIRAVPSNPEVIIITGLGDPEGAELAVKNGAWDYIQKPLTKGKVTLQLERALEYREKRSTFEPLENIKRDGLIGSSYEINVCFDLLAQTVHSDTNVLITGETGTGKELFAQAIHDNSLRAKKNFVVVDCTVLPEKLVESVLFGHEKGAFTGADKTHLGLIKQADGGTLFLDEVGELPLSIQKTFLRVLQEQRFRPVGSNREVSSSFRLVAATNRNLDQLIQTGQFRQDLLFRLQTFTIELPPLKERIEDIKEITMYHMAKICERHTIEPKSFSPEFFDTLAAYNWPGNVRELVNTLERAIAMEPLSPVLFPNHLPHYIRAHIVRSSVTKETALTENTNEAFQHSQQLSTMKALRAKSISEFESRYLHDLMLQTSGDIKEACLVSGLGRARLYELMKKHCVNRYVEYSLPG